MKKFFISAIAVALVAAFAIPAMAVDFSGQVNVRGQYNKNKGFDEATPASAQSAFLEQRTTLTAEAHPTDSTTVEISIQTSTLWGDESDPIKLHAAWLQEDNLFGSDISVRIGHQTLSYDDQRIIGALNWSMVPNSDDAIKFMYRSDEFDVDVFAIKDYDGITADAEDEDIMGIHATIKTIANNTLSVYAFAQYTGTVDTRYTIGARLKGEASGVDYTVELPFQTGQQTDAIDYSAMAFAARVGYSLGGANNLRIGGEYAYASGDELGSADENGAFTVIQPTGHAHLGSMDVVGVSKSWTNLTAYSANLSANATPDLKIIAAYWRFIQNEKAAGVVEDDLGSEIDFTAIYKYNKAFTIKGGYSLFFPGDQQEELVATDTETAHWAFLQGIVNF